VVPRVEPRVLTEYAEDRRPVLPKVLPILENVPPMSRRTPEHSESETETSSGCLKRRKGLRFLIKELVDGDFVALLLVGADATDLVPGDMGDAGGVDRARDRENILSSLRADISSLFNLLRRGMMR
jgi:hypothetical protein